MCLNLHLSELNITSHFNDPNNSVSWGSSSTLCSNLVFFPHGASLVLSAYFATSSSHSFPDHLHLSGNTGPVTDPTEPPCVTWPVAPSPCLEGFNQACFGRTSQGSLGSLKALREEHYQSHLQTRLSVLVAAKWEWLPLELPAACAIPIFPTLLAGKREAGVTLPLFSISALLISFFPIIGLAQTLTPYPWRDKMDLCLPCQEAPDSLRPQAVPGSTSATGVGDALREHADKGFCKSYCHRGGWATYSRTKCFTQAMVSTV